LRERFLKMQAIAPDGRPEGNCMTENRMLLIDGVPHHESNVDNALGRRRALTRMTRDGSETACLYGIDVRTRVKSVR
jgi:hypothetical protein